MPKISFFNTSFFVLFLLLSAAPISNLYSQQYNTWYFGRNAGLSFQSSSNQSIPVTLSNSAMQSAEAAAAISDENGNLLFYTNGVTVYNRSHQVMYNGNDLGGNASSCQISIVPVPGNDNFFYIFTADVFENSFSAGYQYATVDMAGDFGNGEVTSKNNVLWSSCTERMATVRHANGIDIWLITNDKNSNIFRAWLINCSGLQTTPVVSTVGVNFDLDDLLNVGVLKASPDGKMLCQTHFSLFNGNSSLQNFIQLFDFDNATGFISNPRSISIPNVRYCYGEFSPNSKLLYLSSKDDKKIDQLDVSLSSAGEIEASQVSFPTPTSYFDMQLAPDEKIYLTQSNNMLAVINQPDKKGIACDFQRNKISLSPGSAFLGLPSHINDIISYNDPNNGFNYTILDSCTGQVQFNSYSILPPNHTWEWDFGDGNTSTLQNPLHTFASVTKVYTVRLKISSSGRCGAILRSKLLAPSGIIIGHTDYTHVVRCDSGYVRFINTSDPLFQDGTTYIWDFGDGDTTSGINPSHSYASSGSYVVKLKLSTGTPCLDDSITYTVDFTSLSINAIPDQIINLGESVLLTTTGPDDADYTWTPDTWLNSNMVKSPLATPNDDILYKVTATNSDNCKSQDSVYIKVIKPDEPDDIDNIYVPGAFTPNNDGRNDFMKPFLPRNIQLKKFSIFNRSGQMVFSSTERDKGWDGKLNGVAQNNEIFVWVLQAEDETGLLIERKGTVVLIR